LIDLTNLSAGTGLARWSQTGCKARCRVRLERIISHPGFDKFALGALESAVLTPTPLRASNMRIWHRGQRGRSTGLMGKIGWPDIRKSLSKEIKVPGKTPNIGHSG
jgi:hypothetical protein